MVKHVEDVYFRPQVLCLAKMEILAQRKVPHTKSRAGEAVSAQVCPGPGSGNEVPSGVVRWRVANGWVKPQWIR